jgi:hypothetical protein
MGDPPESINRILVALDDGHKTTALQASQNPASHDQIDEATLTRICHQAAENNDKLLHVVEKLERL